MRRQVFLLAFLLSGPALCLGQTSCPRVFPSSIHLYLPAALPPGPHPFVLNEARVWVFCDTAPSSGLPIQATVAGSDIVTADASSNALAESNTSYLWPNLAVTALSTALTPVLTTQQASVQIRVGDAVATLPVTVTFTSKPIIHASESSLGFRFPGDAPSQDEPVWFPNAQTPLQFSVDSQSDGWLTVTPVSGSGHTELSVQADSSSATQGSHTGFITIAAPDAVNSPLKIPVRMMVDSPSH